jgi:hypothetical protein
MKTLAPGFAAGCRVPIPRLTHRHFVELEDSVQKSPVFSTKSRNRSIWLKNPRYFQPNIEMQHPDFRTIYIFRSKRLAGRVDKIFTQIVQLLNEEGFVSLKVQYIDGTKIESVASKCTFVWRGSVEKNKAKLEENVKSVLKAAEDALASESAEEHQELTAEEMASRADRILDRMDKEGLGDKNLRKTVEKIKTENLFLHPFDICYHQKEIILIRINDKNPSVSEIVNQNDLLSEFPANILRNP